jgi:enolase
VPTGANSFSEAMQMGSEVYQTLRKVIKETYGKGTCKTFGFVNHHARFCQSLLRTYYAHAIKHSLFYSLLPH